MAKVIEDFPSQFQDLPRINALVEAVERELDETRRMLDSLQRLLDIETAEDKLLDGLGDIVVLSRAQAGLLAHNGITFPVIDDERYRRFIRYKILKNTSICNIDDILTAITMLWGVEPKHYEEPPDEPATMSVTFDDPGGGPEAYDDIPPIKAAGVGIHIRAASERREDEALYTGVIAGVHEDVSVGIVSKDAHARVGLCAGSAAFISDEWEFGPAPRAKRARIPLYAGCAAMVEEALYIGAIPRKGGMIFA